jgi:hypothetical protein
MSNYFEIEAISNSLLKKVETYYRYGIDKARWTEKLNIPNSDAIETGTLVDELISEELQGNEIVCLDDLLVGFTPKELEFIEKAKTMSPFDAYVNTYDNKETRLAQEHNYLIENYTEKLLTKEHTNSFSVILTKADELFNRARPYYDALELAGAKRIVNKEVYETVNNCYQALLASVEYNNIFGSNNIGLFDNISLYKQLEIYWQYKVTKLDKIYTFNCKSKIDLLKIDYDNKIVYIGDLKTHSQNLERTIKNNKYVRQLSFYAESVKYWLEEQGHTDFTFKYYIVGCHTQYYEVKVIEIEEYAIERAKSGGFIKLDFFTHYENNRYNPYMYPNQVEFMKYSGIWNIDPYDEFIVLGWVNLLMLYTGYCNNEKHIEYETRIN